MRVAGATAEAFTPASLAEVHRLSGGVPRIINVICDRALLGAFTHEDHRVGGKLVRDAATQVYGRPMPAPWLRWAIIGSLAAALVLVAAGLWSLLASRPPASTDATAADVAPVVSNQIARAETTQAPPPAPPSFDEVLARHGNDTTTEAALGKLFASWGATYDPSGGRGCDQAAHQGLECLFQKGSWAQLRTLNRPAILTLTDDIGRTHQVLLTSLGEETATIDLGGESRSVSIAGVSRYWFGDFLLLWRPPLAVAKALAPGRPAAPAGSDFYDEDLARLVQDFQRQHRLNIDGVAGVQTQIVLDTVVNATGSPTIVAQISGG